MRFPDFMLREQNRVPAWQQNTPGIEGYYYTGGDGSQMAFWTYTEDRVSKEHRHDYDEYMLCVEGEYVVTIDGVEHTLHAGDELFIPKGSLQGGRVKAGTRSIHAFGGQRVVPYEMVSYTDGMKDAVFDFLTKAFIDAGKCFEPGARHGIYNDIPRNFDLFLCMMDGGRCCRDRRGKKAGWRGLRAEGPVSFEGVPGEKAWLCACVRRNLFCPWQGVSEDVPRLDEGL
ncbi:MAG: cupin domain-containing protein [Treponema sp.]|nr:cupin domain-containing protein [Treponema sp.]